jgi:hypothetical protein
MTIMNTIKVAAVFMLFFTLTPLLSAQKIQPSHGEVGLGFSGLDLTDIGFNAFWKKQLAPDKYRRYRFFTGSFFAGAVDEDFLANATVGMGIGREKRINLDEKLQFYRGVEFFGAIGFVAVDDIGGVLFNPNIGLVFGLQHSLNDRWAINIETIPSIGLTLNVFSEDGPDSEVAVTGRANSSVTLGLVRKF